MAKKPQKEIWVYGDLRNERLFSFSLNVLSKAGRLALSISGKTAAFLMGSSMQKENGEAQGTGDAIPVDEAVDRCNAHGSDHVYVLENDALSLPRADIYAGVLAGLVAKHDPMLVMFALTDFGREMAARTSRILNAGLISECAEIHVEEDRVIARCPAWGGNFMGHITFLDGSRPGFVTMQTHTEGTSERNGRPGTVERLHVEIPETQKGLKLLSVSPEKGEARNLEDAPVVVVGGAGMGGIENFGLVRDLASAIGAELGATRPPVLEHWVEEERLIGQTGKSVRPELLFSIGTSGAVQYTAGIMESKTVVAINRDKHAPIFQMADIGIVADANALLPHLTSQLKRTVMRKLADDLYVEGSTRSPKAFGAKVRRLRETHGWTIEGLAQAVGESPEFVRKVETGDVAPPVAFLLRFAKALKVDPGTFLRREEKALIRSLRAQALMKRTQNYSYQTLSPGAESHHLRAFMVTIEARQTHKPVAYKHEGEEFIFVMEGELKLTLGKTSHHLKAGESVHFNSDIPHKLKNISSETTHCLVVLYTP